MRGKKIIRFIIFCITMVFPITFISIYSLVNFIPTNYPDWVDYVIVYVIHCIIFYIGWTACRREHKCYTIK